MKRKWLGLALAAAMACAGAVTQSAADVLAEDSAANYTAETFVSGANLGTGFGAWEFWNAAPTLADSTAGVCGDINSENGVSFRFAQDGVEDHWGYCNGYRGFDALNPGDVLTFRFTCAYCGGNRGLDLFANGGHDDSDKIANVINLSGDNEYSVNGVVIANNWAPHAVSEVTVSQLEDGIEIAIKRTSTEEGVEDLEYSTKVETSSKLTGIGLYAGGWDWNDGADVENYAFYVNDLKIEGVPPADTLKLEGPWAVTKASAELEFTLSRKSTDGDLEVALTSSYPEFAAVPDTVTIPDGESSVTFVVTAAVQGNGNVAAIQASAEGIAGDSFEVKGPSYSCNPWDEGVEDPWNVDVDEERTFYVDSPFFEDAGFDNSLVTVASSDESVIGIASKQDWAQGENGMYAAWTVTGIGGGKATAQVLFAGIPMTEYGFTVPQAGATLSGPTSIRVGVPTTYTLDVTLPTGMTDSLGLETEGEIEVVIDPAEARELEASGQLEFTVTAMAAGTFTLLPFDNEGLSFNELQITASEAPDYSDYVAYDDASLYSDGFDFSAVGEGTDQFQAWSVFKDSAEFGGAIITTADGGFPAILSDGSAFAIYANGSNPDYAIVRPFVNDLQPGQKASIEFAVPQEGGSRYIQFARIWEGTPYNRFEIWASGGKVGVNVDSGESQELSWAANVRRVVASVQRAADGSEYTLSLEGYNEGSEFADDVFQYSIDSDVGSWGDGLQGIVIGGYDLASDFIFNKLAIEQVEEPVKIRAIGFSEATYNPDVAEVPYKFAIGATTDDIGVVNLSVTPDDGGLVLSAASVDLTGTYEAEFTVTVSAEALPAEGEGTKYTITATPVDDSVAAATYDVTPRAPYIYLTSDNWEYNDDQGAIWVTVHATPSHFGTYYVTVDPAEGVLGIPELSQTIEINAANQDACAFDLTVVGAGEANVYIAHEGALDPSADFHFLIHSTVDPSDEPTIDGTTVVNVKFSNGFSAKATGDLEAEYTGVKAQRLEWNGSRDSGFEPVGEELVNQATWPEMKFDLDDPNAVLRFIFVK